MHEHYLGILDLHLRLKSYTGRLEIWNFVEGFIVVLNMQSTSVPVPVKVKKIFKHIIH